MKLKIFAIIFACAFAATSFAGETNHTFVIGTNDFLLDGQKFQIRCGEIHAALDHPVLDELHPEHDFSKN